MRYFYLPACMFALLALSQASQAEERMPNLNVEKSCMEARDSTGADPDQTYKNCLADEIDARKTLAQKWSSFKPGTRRSCVEAGATPNPSYVELLTCLEMFNGTLMPGDITGRETPSKQ